MKQRKSLFGLLLSGILLTAGAARADGLAAGPGDLPAEAKKTLKLVEADRSSNFPNLPIEYYLVRVTRERL